MGGLVLAEGIGSALYCRVGELHWRRTLVGAHDGKAGLCRFGGAGGVVAPGRALNDSAFVCELGAWPHPSRRAPAAETGIGQLPVEVSPNGVDFFGRRPARLPGAT